MKYFLIILKRTIEDIFIYPFVLYGRYLSKSKPLKEEYEVFLLFPFYHIGGAEKVHESIANALSNKKALIIFTRKSHNDLLLDSFKKSGHHMIDISFYTDNKLKYWNNLIFRGLVSGHINRQKKKPVIFNGQSNFAYKLSRWISEGIPQIELIHSFSSFSYIRLPFIQYYEKTIMISKIRIQDHLKMYKNWGVPQYLAERIEFILNGIALPLEKPDSKESLNSPIRILYVGRGTKEKRIPLLSKIIAQLQESEFSINATFVGDVGGAVPNDYKNFIHLTGNINNQDELDHYYRESDILIMVSDTEGFPLAIMEAMARGCIIISTDVGDIPVHVVNGKNGFLFSDTKNEQLIIQEAISFIHTIYKNPGLFHEMSRNNIQYAYEHFGLKTFSEKYQQLINFYQ